MTRTDLMKTIKRGGDLSSYDGFTDISENTPTQQKLLLEDSTPMIYICATMWHESEQEMIYMLKSIFRCVKALVALVAYSNVSLENRPLRGS